MMIIPLILWTHLRYLWSIGVHYFNQIQLNPRDLSLFRQYFFMFAVITLQCTVQLKSNLKISAQVSIHFSWNERIVYRTLTSIAGRRLVFVYRRVHLRVCWNIGVLFECSKTSTDRQFTGRLADVANRLGSAPWHGY